MALCHGLCARWAPPVISVQRGSLVTMQVRLLGSTSVDVGGKTVALRGTKQRVVLTLLAIELGNVVPRDSLIEAGWGDDLPKDPPNALQYQVAQLRKLVEDDPANPDFIQTDGAGYRLASDRVRTDIVEFRSRTATARDVLGEDPNRARELVDEALDLWRGPALGRCAIRGLSRGLWRSASTKSA